MRITLVSTLFLVLYFSNYQIVYAQDTSGKWDEYLGQIQKLASEEKPEEQIRLMVEASDYLHDSDFGYAFNSQYLFQLSGIPIDIESLTHLESQDPFLLGKAYEFDGTSKLMQGQYSEAKKSYHRATELIAPDRGVHTAYRWLGVVSGVLEDFEDGASYYEKAIEAAQQFYKQPTEKKYGFLARAHINLSSVCARIFDLGRAKSLAQKAIEYVELSKDESLYVSAKVVLAQAEMNLKNPDVALDILNDIENRVTDDHPIAVNYYNTKANVLLQQDDNANAIINYQKSAEITQSPAVKMLNAGGQGEALLNMKNYNGAIAKFSELLDYYESQGGGFTSSYSQTLNRRAEAHLGNQDLLSAKKDITAALSISSEYEALKIINQNTLVSVYAQSFEETKNESFIDSLFQTMTHNDLIISEVRERHRYYDDILELNVHVHDAYARNLKSLAAVKKSSDKFIDEDIIFKYFEGIKSYSLKEILKTDDAVQIGEVAQEVLDQERQWKYKLSTLQQEIFQADQQKDVEVSDSLSTLYFKTKDSYIKFLKQLESDYPNYYRFQYQDNTPRLQDVQEVLREEDLVVEYFLDDENIYILKISKNDVDFQAVAKPSSWDDLVAQFRDACTNSDRVIDQNVQAELQKEFVSSASQLYNVLLKDVLKDVNDVISDLIIIPDDELNVIPFDILLTDTLNGDKGYKALSYLLRKYNISYEQSATDLTLQKESGENKTNYLGFAPEYQLDNVGQGQQMKDRATLSDLPQARSSVERIASLLRGESFTGQKAEKKKFLGVSESASVLHLAMHGIINQSKPAFSRLAFSTNDDDNIYASEIYNLSLNTDLAVLSACNTGTGRIINGDGVQNFSRAFRFAGARSTIMSLWSVPDEQTAEINYSFFENLNNGQPIDVALKNAKLSYLEASPQLGSHPFFWAGFVSSGQTDRILVFANNSGWGSKLLLLGLLVLGLILFFRLKSK